jgi:glycosyltransferase involved in cell wall biosynthesis
MPPDLKEPILNRSLSVILPVHNAQSWLSEQGGQILDVVAELTDRFELLILDDGSTDSTYDVARELVRRYPQVRLLREPVRRGATLGIRRSFRESRGDIVMTHDGERALDAQEIVRLWRSLQSPARAPESMRPTTKAMRRSPFSTARARQRDVARANAVGPQSSTGFRLLRPGAISDLRRPVAAVPEIAGKDVARRRASESESFKLTTGIDPATRNAPRPNFLSRVKSRVRDFTVGE